MPPRALTLAWHHQGIAYKITIAGGTGIITATGPGFSQQGEFEYPSWLIHEFRRWNNAQRTEFARTVLETSNR